MLIDHDGLKLNVIDEGSGHPIVFLHGLGANFRNWENQLNGFNRDFRTVAPDLRGAGQSARSAEPYRPELFTDDVIAVCAKLGIEHAYVVGQSLGGWIAQALAIRHPAFVDALVLVGAGCYADPKHRPLKPLDAAIQRDGMAAVPGMVMNLVYPEHFRRRRPDIIAQFARELTSCDPEDFVQKMRMTSRLDFRDRLPKVQAPTLVVGGEHDRVWPPDASRLIASLLPNAQCIIFPNSGHQPHVEEPDLFNRTLREYIEANQCGR